MRPDVKLGMVVEDQVTHFKGVVVAITNWLNGCERITVQPSGVDKDGQPIDPCIFDTEQLKIIKNSYVAKPAKAKKSGGPRGAAERKAVSRN